MKKVSIILTTYNCKNNLRKTLESIERQDYPNVEIIIKDGKSTDGTIEVIQEHKKVSRYDIVWKSEADTGIYDAMNRGYELCTGDIIVFFNDVFVDEFAISKMMNLIMSDKPGGQWIGAHADLYYAIGDKIVREWHMGEGNIYQGWMPGHPTLFLKREIYEKYGLFDTSYKISADYEFMVRFLKDENNRLAYLPEKLVAMFYGGTSTGGIKDYLLSFIESYRALKDNKIESALLITIKRAFKVLKQFKK